MHVLLTDLIDSQGGTGHLVKILNNFGICASIDTLNRFVHGKLEQNSHPSTPFRDCSNLVLVSVDNLDFQHKFAQVTQGRTNSGFHGTTVQVVKPLPALELVYTSTSPSLSQKRAERTSSPTRSPLTSLLNVPQPKKKCRARTGLEGKDKHVATDPRVPVLQPGIAPPASRVVNRSLSDFQINDLEIESLASLQQELFNYMIQSMAVNGKVGSEVFIGLKEYFNLTRVPHTQQSEIAYLQVMDAKSDSKDTILDLLHDLHSQFIRDTGRDYLVVAGDQKLFSIFRSLKIDHNLDWVLPMPGDWHILMNFQKAIMKPYFDAGFKHLAVAAGYPAATIEACGQFKRTHQFLMEVWKALYRAMITAYLSGRTEDPLGMIADKLAPQSQPVGCDKLHDAIPTELLTQNYDRFKIFMRRLAQQDATWRFWIQCVFDDLLAYVGLYLAMRSGDWCLRTASIKKMAPTFTAFNHYHYTELIGSHIADLLALPENISTQFQQGAFVASISGTPWHSVAIDECHETMINKSCKMAIVRPTEEYINRVIHYLPTRAKALDNLANQLPSTAKRAPPSCIATSNSRACRHKENVSNIVQAIEKHKLFAIPTGNRGLFNAFTNEKATQQQTSDLLNYRHIGQQEYERRVRYDILKTPSSTTTATRIYIQTFSKKKATGRN